MPDPTPVAPAPAAVAAPAPAPTPTPPPATPAAADAAPKSNRKIAESLAALLTAPTPALDAPKKPEPAKPKEEAPKPPAADKPIKVKAKTPTPTPEEKAPPVPRRGDAPAKPVVAEPSPTPAPAAPAKAQTDEEFEKDLLEEERAQLDDARAAEKYLPEKYKGHAAKQRDFLKENAAKSAKVESGELDAADYKEWYEKARPKIGALDYRAIERARVTEEVTAKFEPKIEEERHARWTEAEAPKIKRRGDELFNRLTATSLPDEVTAAFAERTKGISDPAEVKRHADELTKEFALEFEVADEIIKATTANMEEFYRLVTINPQTGKPLKARNTDLSTDEGKLHASIAASAHRVCDEFKATGGPALKRDGKWFATWREWSEMAPEQQAGWWTFSNEELAEHALKGVKGIVAAEVKRRNDYLAGRGYTRAPRPAATVPATPPSALNGAPPAPRPAPPPAGGSTPAQSAGSRLAAKLL